MNAWGEGVPSSKLLTRRKYRSEHTMGTSVCPFTWVCQEYSTKRKFSFYDILLLGWSLGEWSQLRKIGVPDSKDLWALLVLKGVCIAVTVCGASRWAKKRVGRSTCVLVWLPVEQPLLRSVGLDSQCKTDRSTVQCSCPKVAVRKTSSGNITFSLRVQCLCLGRISLSVAYGQAQPDVEHWDWYPNTLLYFSSCQTLLGLCT